MEWSIPMPIPIRRLVMLVTLITKPRHVDATESTSTREDARTHAAPAAVRAAVQSGSVEGLELSQQLLVLRGINAQLKTFCGSGSKPAETGEAQNYTTETSEARVALAAIANATGVSASTVAAASSNDGTDGTGTASDSIVVTSCSDAFLLDSQPYTIRLHRKQFGDNFMSLVTR